MLIFNAKYLSDCYLNGEINSLDFSPKSSYLRDAPVININQKDV